MVACYLAFVVVVEMLMMDNEGSRQSSFYLLLGYYEFKNGASKDFLIGGFPSCPQIGVYFSFLLDLFLCVNDEANACTSVCYQSVTITCVPR